MKKRSALSLLLAVMMIAMLIPAHVFAETAAGPVSVILGNTNTENGLTAWSGDGPGNADKVTVDGKSGWKTNPAKGARYIYLNVGNSYIYGGTNAVNITFEYYDSAEGAGNTFSFSYDSTSNAWDYNVPKTYLTGSNTWKTVTYSLKDAQFSGRENGADFRVETSVPVIFGSVSVEKSLSSSVATEVRLEPSETTLYIGATATAVATVRDQNGYLMNKAAAALSSSDSTVAKIDSAGKITALKTGTAVLTAKYGTLSTTANVTVTDIDGPVSVTLGAYYKENGMSALSGDGAGRTTETYDGISGWQTNPASGAHYIYFKISDYFLNGGKNTVNITVDYYDAAVSGEKGFLIAYDSTSTPFAYTDKTLLKGSNTWKQVTYTVEDAQFSNRENNGADFRLETSVPTCFSKVTVELIPTVSMRGESMKAGSIFTGNEQAAVKVVFDNQFDTGKELDVSYNVLDFANSPVDSGEFHVSLNPNHKGLAQQLTFGSLPKGTYTVSIDAVSPDGAIKLHEDIHMGVITDLTGKTVHSFFGLNTHFSKGYGGSDVRIPLAFQTGATTIRDSYSGNVTYIDNALAKGISTFIVTSTDTATIQQTAMSLKGKVDAFEIGNELSTHYTPEQYLVILQAAYNAIKSIDPNMKVVGGVTLQYDEPWLKRLVDLGAADYLDAISFHIYSTRNPEGAGVIRDFLDLHDYIESKGIAKDIELWLTEIGWPTSDPDWGGTSEILSAAYGAQLYVDNLANDTLIDKIYWYDFLNDCTDNTFFECAQGVLNVDNTPKPSFVAFNTVSDQLAGAVFVQSYNALDSDIRIYKFYRAADNKDIYVIWSNLDKQIGLKLGSSQVAVADIFGNVRPYDTVGGAITFTASAVPVYITGNFIQDPELAAPAFAANTLTVAAAPGEETQMTISRSAGAEAISGTYEVHLPLGWQLVSGGTFSAGQTADTLTFRAPSTKIAGEIRIYPKGNAGELYGSLRLEALMKDPVVVQAAPVVNSAGTGWDLAVKISNQNSQVSMTGGTVTVLEPADMAGSAAFAPVTPNSSTTVKFPAPSINSETTMPIKLRVDRDDGFTQTIERSISSLTAVKANQPIVIDGNINGDEWNNALSFTLDKASQVKLIADWGGPDDLSAVAYTKWDSDHLYLAVSVTDNTHLNNYLPGDLWKGDSLQFTIDPGRSIAPGKLGWSENGIALNSATNAVMKTGGYGGNDLANSSVSIKRNGNKTEYELAIKWTDILPSGMLPSSGTNLGFSFLVNDNDGTVRRGWMEYMSGVGLAKNPNLYGDLILTDLTAFPANASQATAANVSPAQPDGQNGWYTQPVTISFTADPGAALIEYSLDEGSTWQLYGAPVTFAQDSVYNVVYRSISQSGIAESSQTLSFKLDGTAPVTAAAVVPDQPDGPNGSYRQPVTVSLNASDHLSSVTETVYSLDGGAVWALYTAPVTFDQDGEYAFSYRSTDAAGNEEAVQTIAISIVRLPTIETIAAKLKQYEASGELAGPLAKQLANSQKQAEHQFSKASMDQAVKHLEQLLKHLNNPQMSMYVSDQAKADLTAAVSRLIDVWSYGPESGIAEADW